ncbi:MAG: CPBP family intramembrane glutamic endopeptidase [Chloroflexota bacterium]
MIGAVLQYGVIYWGIPRLNALGLEPLVAWMMLSVPLIFLPIIAYGLVLLRTEDGNGHWVERLRFQRPSAQDWLWGLSGLLGISIGSLAMFKLCGALSLNPVPPFARNVHPLTVGQLWILPLWAIYWPINILGENLVWRGIILPRMEARLGDRAWLLNAFLWGVFHLAFGLGNLLVLLPTLILVPLIAQQRQNTWLAVLMHGGLSLPGFIALFLGLSVGV